MKSRIVSSFTLFLISHLAFAQGNNIDLKGLQRFNPQKTLETQSQWDIKGAFVGGNVLATTQNQQKNDGEVHYISGGNRSRLVKISFFQPYQDSQLEQRLELSFDKDKGFINQVELNYQIQSAYLSIQPVYEKVLQQAVLKYGEPLSFAQVQSIAKTSKQSVRVSEFKQQLRPDTAVAQQILDFFEGFIVTPKTRFVADSNDRALLLSGFRQCYVWQSQDFSEILSLCSFQPSSGNRSGQGVTLSLLNFAVNNAIASYNDDDKEGINISL